MTIQELYNAAPTGIPILVNWNDILGEEFEFIKTDDDGLIVWRPLNEEQFREANLYAQLKNGNTANYIIVDVIETETQATAPHPCTCDFHTVILRSGCQCQGY